MLVNTETLITDKARRIWTPRQMLLASFLGGPLVGCYQLSQNYAVLKDKSKSRKSLIIGVFATVIIFALPVFFQIPKAVRTFVIPIGCAALVFEYAKRSQGEQIDELRNSGVKKRSYFKLILLSALFHYLSGFYGITLSNFLTYWR